MDTKICLTLIAPTLRQNLEITERYRAYIDIVELRADCLNPEEYPYIRTFPAMAGLPCILTVRRQSDGGNFAGGEGSRTVLFARGLSYADTDPRKNFAYVDLEEDFQIESIEEVARGFNIKIIRSLHNMTDSETDLEGLIHNLRKEKDEIAKIAFMPKTLADVTSIFRAAAACRDEEFTLIAMGPLGIPTRILAPILGSQITYCAIPFDDPTLYPDRGAAAQRKNILGQLDPVTLTEIYNFRSISRDTEIFAIAGYPMESTSSPLIHNAGYKKHGKNAVYIPIRAATIGEVFDFADEINVKGMSVTHPFKESVLPYLKAVSPEAGKIGASNTLVRQDGAWVGYNTDIDGFKRALLEFLGVKDLRHMHVSIIGAGGVARAIALAVKKLKGKACVFNRTPERAKNLADIYGFKWAALDRGNVGTLKKYSDLIIQTTSAGMFPDTHKDPVDFYTFTGDEAVYDAIYTPEKTKMLLRAEQAGCRICNGWTMLQYQAYKQYSLFTGEEYGE